MQAEPEMSDLGIGGTFINHPFRLSDNINRFLLLVRILLAPGRFVGLTIFDLWRLARAEDVPAIDER